MVERCWNGNTASVGKFKVERIVCDVIRGGGDTLFGKRTSIPGTNGREYWPLIVPLC